MTSSIENLFIETCNLFMSFGKSNKLQVTAKPLQIQKGKQEDVRILKRLLKYM